jgi:hypothetical protein
MFYMPSLLWGGLRVLLGPMCLPHPSPYLILDRRCPEPLAYHTRFLTLVVLLFICCWYFDVVLVTRPVASHAVDVKRRNDTYSKKKKKKKKSTALRNGRPLEI